MPQLLTTTGHPTPRIDPRTSATALSTYLPLENGENARTWLGGFSFLPIGCQELLGVAQDLECEPDQLAAFVDNIDFMSWDGTDEGDLDDGCVTFKPYGVRVMLSTRTLQAIYAATDPVAYMRQHLDLSRSAILAREVLLGTLTGGPSLNGEADVEAPLTGTPMGALAAVVNGLGERLHNGGGMIHVAPGMFDILAAGGGFVQDGGVWRTPSGHRVVADAGYVSQPNVIYGSGPVRFALGAETTLGMASGGFTMSTNTIVTDIQQSAITVWEPCSAVKSTATTL